MHRDIKPENIMLRSDGYIKVLDFGLAKAGEQQKRGGDSITTPGLLMGTVKYMSPEQARGFAVDSRSDIFSLGVIMYEMITGNPPFEGNTNSDLIAAILKDEPLPLAHYSPTVPDELQRIITRALNKDSEVRYQDLQSMADDLKRLKQEFELASQHPKSQDRADSVTTTTSSVKATINTANDLAFSTSSVGTVATSSDNKHLTGEIKRRKTRAIAILFTMLIAIASIIYGVSRLSSDRRTPFQEMRITRLTNSGKIGDAAISPDGKRVAYSLYGNGQSSLWLKDLSAGSDAQILPPAEAGYGSLTFSPDGNYVYYIQRNKTDPEGALYQTPVTGGETTKLLVGIVDGVTFSPDGRQIAFLRNDDKQGESLLMLANFDGTGEKKLATRKNPSELMSPSWSPDGKVIACAVFEASGDGQGNQAHVVEVRIADGAERPFSGWWRGMTRIVWLADGSGLLMVAREHISKPRQVWFLSYPGGEARRITNDTNVYDGQSVTTDSSLMIAVQKVTSSSIWIAPNEDLRQAKEITSEANKGDGQAGLSYTPDGKIVYESDAGQNDNIWIMNADGSNRKQLTSDTEPDFEPLVTPDGRYIVFVSIRNGWGIWRMNADGSDLRHLTQVSFSTDLQSSQDSQWIIYLSRESSGATLRKISIEGGEPIELRSKLFCRPAISPDGKLIAGFYQDEQTNRWKIGVIPFSGGDPIKVFDTPEDVDNAALRWTVDGRALTYCCRSNIWSQPIDGGTPKQLTDFKSQEIAYFDWSHDGRHLAIVRTVESSDIVLISDFK